MLKLRAKHKKYLKRLVNKEIPTVQIGKEGITDNIIRHIDEVLEHNELIKINILDIDSYPLKETAGELSQKTNSAVIKTIGKKIILYRESKTLEEENKITLPS